MKRYVLQGMLALVLAAGMAACGPKNGGDADEPGGGTGGEGGATTEPQISTLQKLVDRLNAAIADGNEAEAKAILEGQTADMLVEAMGLVPELELAGEDAALIDYLDWEKANGIVFVLENEDAAANKATLVGKKDDLAEFKGEVDVIGDGDAAQLEFLDLAAGRRDEIMSENLQREKLLEVVVALNKAIADQDEKAFQSCVTNDTINNEVKLFSFSTKKKSNWNVKTLLKKLEEDGVVFSVTGLDPDSGEGTLVLKDEDGLEIRKGDVKFVSEIGKMRLDYAALANFPGTVVFYIDDAQAELDAKKKPK